MVYAVASFWGAACALLVQVRAAEPIGCTFPPGSDAAAGPGAGMGSGGGAVDAQITCMPGTVDPLTATTTFTTSGKPMPPQHYLDVKATTYDMSPVASFVNSSSGHVKAAIIHR